MIKVIHQCTYYDISKGENNTVVSAYTLYCSHPSICDNFSKIIRVSVLESFTCEDMEASMFSFIIPQPNEVWVYTGVSLSVCPNYKIVEKKTKNFLENGR